MSRFDDDPIAQIEEWNRAHPNLDPRISQIRYIRIKNFIPGWEIADLLNIPRKRWTAIEAGQKKMNNDQYVLIIDWLKKMDKEFDRMLKLRDMAARGRHLQSVWMSETDMENMIEDD